MDDTAPTHSGVQWFKSSFSAANTQCVEVAFHRGQALLRDSKLGQASPILAFTRAEWEAFTAGVKAKEFDVAD